MLTRDDQTTYEMRDSEIDSMWNFSLDKGMTHVILDDFYVATVLYVYPAVSKYKECFKELYRTEAPVTYVLEVDTTCLRNSLGTNPLDMIEELKDIRRLHLSGKTDSLEHRLSRYNRSNEELKRILGHINYVVSIERADDARMAFEAAAIIYPDNPTLWLNWGTELKRIGRIDESIEACRKALEYGADSSECINNIGFAYTGKGDFVNAEKYFEKAVRLNRYDPEIMINWLSALLYLKQYQKVRTILKQELARDDVDSEYSERIESFNEHFHRWEHEIREQNERMNP